MLKDKLNEYLNSNKILPSKTFAYRKHLSAPMCINELLQTVAILKASGEKVVICQLDISNAYDCVHLKKLYMVLFNFNIPVDIINGMIAFLSHRSLCLGDKKVKVYNGLPQGSCLSPLLFNLYTASLHSLENSNTKIFQFADDFIILSNAKNFVLAASFLNQTVNLFKNNCKELNLSFNLEKTNTLYFAQNSYLKINLKIDNKPITQVKKIKFLGRIISESQSVLHHYKNAFNDCKNNSNLLKSLTSIKGGLKPQYGLNFYKSYVRSKLEYGRTTTAHSPESTDKRIRTFQNSHIRICLGCTPSTPYHNLYALANELPPKERAIFLTSKEILNTILYKPDLFELIVNSMPVKTSYSFVYYKFKYIFDKVAVPGLAPKCNKCTFVTNLVKSTKNNTAIETLKAVFAETLDTYKINNFTVIATDASISSISTGCAVFFIQLSHFFLFKIDSKLSSLTGGW